MLIEDDRGPGEQLLLEVSRSNIHSAGGPRAAAPSAGSPPASNDPAGLLERTDERTADRPAPAVETPMEPGHEESGPGAGIRTGRSRRLPMALASVLLASAAAAGYLWWDNAAHFESTDDAFIAARQFSVAPKVAGYIASVPVTDNQHVNVGDVIARIDDRDYKVALAQTEGQVQASDFGVRNVDMQTVQQQSQISANEALVKQQEAALTFAQEQAVRYQALYQKGAGSQETAQQYASQLEQAREAVDVAKGTRNVAQRQLETLKSLRGNALGALAQAQAQRDQAKLNLEYTTVVAAESGRVANLSAAVGEYATAGTALVTLVPDDIWITANFKETQLDRMRPGQPVTIAIDAYPERVFHGRVASVQPGSGTAFSLLPAENATGNYVKIVQRVPVKIVLDDPSADITLGPGMSVVPTVRIDPAPSLYERLKDRVFELLERKS